MKTAKGNRPVQPGQAGASIFIQPCGIHADSALRHDLRQMFMGILVEAAFSAGQPSAAEQAVLLRVAQELRIPAQVFTAMLRARQGGAGQRQGGQAGQGVIRGSLEQAYAQLGLKPDAGESEANGPIASWSANTTRINWSRVACRKK
jgi:hypothetical protein